MRMRRPPRVREEAENIHTLSRVARAMCGVVQAFRQQMDNLNRYCNEKNLDHPMRYRLREYLYRTEQVQVDQSYKELLQLMSPKLQGELELQVDGAWLMSVRFLQGVEVNCCVRIAIAATDRIFVPTELLSADFLYHCVRGTLVHEGEVLAGGQVCTIALHRSPSLTFAHLPSPSLTIPHLRSPSGRCGAPTAYSHVSTCARRRRAPSALSKSRASRVTSSSASSLTATCATAR